MAKTKIRPVHSMAFAGMEGAIEEQEKAARVYQSEELAAKMRESLGDVSGRAGEMEMNAPLFYGKVHPTLF